jgi:predicted ester cyclase
LQLATVVLSIAVLSPVVLQAQGAAPAPSPQAVGQSSTPVAPAPQPQGRGPSEDATDTIPRKYIEYWNTGDVKVMKSFFSPFSHGNRVVVDEPMLTRVVNAWRQSMPDLNFKIEDTITQGNKVAMRLIFTGTYKTRLFASTGDPAKFDPPHHVRVGEMLFFEFKDGKLWTIWEEYDELAMRTQMGALWRTNAELDAAHKSTAPEKPAPKP